jgi:hypothetical protein
MCSSWRLRDFERLLRLTESFTWEDQPTRDPHTGQRTFAGWIPHFQKIIKYVCVLTTFYHLIQSGVRIYISHDLMFSAWYPFDTDSSPGYELAILMQVIPYFYFFQFILISYACKPWNWGETKVSLLNNQIVIGHGKVSYAINWN